MTKLGKILVVFTAVMSLLFAGFIAVTTFGGPNWQVEARSLDDYAFAEQPGETVTWNATRKVAADEQKTVASGLPSLPAAIVRAQDDRQKVQNERNQQLDAELEQVKRTLEAEKQASAQDVEGIRRRLDQLRADADRLDQEIVQLTQQGAEQAEEARRIQTLAEARRGDVARLASELAQVRTDRYRAEEQIRQLNDLFVRLDGLIDRARRRHDQLSRRVGDEPVAAQAAN